MSCGFLFYKTNTINERGCRRVNMTEEIKEKALQLYQKDWKYKDIAEELDISVNTFKSWIRRYGWTKNKGAPTIKKVHPKKVGAPQNNKNAVGNNGGSAPKENHNAVTHGLFSKWLPAETAEIIEAMRSKSESDMIWDSIMIQYTAIIRAQKIMFVDSSNDLSKEVSAEGQFGNTYDIQFAWDKQANFMNAQSRAMSTLSNLIKQFVAIADDQDERRLKLELMQAQISNLKAKTADQDDIIDREDDGFLDALESEGEELWPEE